MGVRFQKRIRRISGTCPGDGAGAVGSLRQQHLTHLPSGELGFNSVLRICLANPKILGYEAPNRLQSINASRPHWRTLICIGSRL